MGRAPMMDEAVGATGGFMINAVTDPTHAKALGFLNTALR